MIQEQQIHKPYSLTEQQVEHFQVFGFLIRRKLFSLDEMQQIQDEFDRRLDAIQRDAGPKEEHQFDNWPNRNPDSPYLASLLEDPRIYVPSEQLLGPGAVPVHSNSNSYFEDTPWHPDTTDCHLLTIKNVMYLQRTTPERGALRVIPGSHQSPLYDELRRIGIKGTSGDEPRFFTESGMRAEDISCHVFSSSPGDLITFNERTWHAAFGGYMDRRTCTFNFYSDPRTAAEKEDLRSQAAYYQKSRKSLARNTIPGGCPTPATALAARVGSSGWMNGGLLKQRTVSNVACPHGRLKLYPSDAFYAAEASAETSQRGPGPLGVTWK